MLDKINIPAIAPKFNLHKAARAHYPILSEWERDLADGTTVAFQVLAHQIIDGRHAMCIEYLAWNNVWGWMPTNRADLLEVTFERGGFQLYSFTDGRGVYVPELVGEA